ncbi:DUF4003 family protein [Sporosalibacterium faouarense]|uniref:DUF4003 family protein n=1 Tax=Sporosalibacterium faouarense TaxID=516123 RepID=UPI00141CAD55|nr:DUF4003 family protein [Sporosalibacterium faouarense]MTI46439.1 DUF4003 domain-containing protein [Bacillota bacterium]
MNSHIHESVENYLEIYHELYRELKWKTNNQILMMISLLYTINEKKFVLSDLIDLSEYIRKNASIFSTLRSHQRFTTAASLITKFDEPKKAFNELIELHDLLVSSGLKKGPYTIISALALMTTRQHDISLEERIDKALAIYKGMKGYHFFLTSQGDYPLAILLSKSELPTEVLMEEIEFYYSNLSQLDFKKGNDLQFLSHILMLTNTENKLLIINRCNRLLEQLINEDLKIRKMHYPQIGLMSIVDRELDEEITLINEISNRFNNTKEFKSSKDMNLTMATLLVISSVIKNLYDDITIIETGISTSIEALVQAQNAALISSITATSAATIG